MANPPVTLEQLRRSARKLLNDAGIASADIDCKLLLSEALRLDAADLIAHAHRIVSDEDQLRFEALLARRAQHEPIAYILEKQAFWSLDFKVSPDVLIPRPETEGVVERALNLLKHVSHPTIVDVGTGSGAILVSLLHERKDANGFGLDISEGALKLAHYNAEKNGVADRATFLKSDYLSVFNGKADLVVSNPPYITDQAMKQLSSTVADYEPSLALWGGNDGLEAYNAIIADLPRVLCSNGDVVFEIGFDQGQAVSHLLTINGFDDIHLFQDLAGHDRVVSGKLSV